MAGRRFKKGVGGSDHRNLQQHSIGDQFMNKPQSPRRPRGRGAKRNKPIGGGNIGNRNDNRNRGNPKQLLEKYKSQAKDALQSGDRVLAEYYFQFADHYQRLTNERFGVSHNDDEDEDDFGDDDDEMQPEPAPHQHRQQQQQQHQQQQRSRTERAEAAERHHPQPPHQQPSHADAQPKDGNAGVEDAAASAATEPSERQAPRRRGRPRREPRQPVADVIGTEPQGSADDAPLVVMTEIATDSDEPRPRRRRRVAEDSTAE